jgi:CheY-like chemotaxis protein
MLQPATPARGRPPRLRILVADDLPVFRLAATDWLAEDGHVAKGAKSGREAAQLLAAEPFDLLITDIIMPDGDGIELIQNARKSLPDLKIVAISAGSAHLGPDYYVAMAKRFGSDAVLLKPFEGRQLREVVAALFSPSADSSAAS